MSDETNTPATWEQVKILSDASDHLKQVIRHYRHAREKHPYFADALILAATQKRADIMLSEFRDQLKREIADGECYAETVMLCELWEVMDALKQGESGRAVAELYDAIAVLLRMVDVLEGRQKLGGADGQKQLEGGAE